MKRTNISKKVLLLLLLAAANMVRGQKYEYVLKTDSTSWDSFHWELEGIMRDHAFVKKVGNEHLLYYSYGNYLQNHNMSCLKPKSPRWSPTLLALPWLLRQYSPSHSTLCRMSPCQNPSRNTSVLPVHHANRPVHQQSG